jgi:hypothetical protein
MIGLSLLQVKGNKQLDTKHYFKVSQIQNDELLLLPTLVSVSVAVACGPWRWRLEHWSMEPVVLPIYIGRDVTEDVFIAVVIGHHHRAARLLNHPNITYVYC